ERVRDGEERPRLARRNEVELLHRAQLPVDRALSELLQPGLLAREEREADVEETIPARALELLGLERRRRTVLALRVQRLLFVERRQPGRLAAQLAARLVAGVALEEPEGDRG